MSDYLTIGRTPYDVPCAQVGSDDYSKLSRIECAVFINQCRSVLEKEYGDNILVSLRKKSFPHDFGMYHEVVAYYDSAEGCKQALFLEGADLSNWDKEALEELERAGYDLHLQDN